MQSVSQDKKIGTNLNGFAKILWPMVTKLVSWFDINQASEETLQNKKHISIDNLHRFKFDDIKVYIFLIIKKLIQGRPSSKYMLPYTQYGRSPSPTTSFSELFQYISHFESFFIVVILNRRKNELGALSYTKNVT